MEANNLNDTLVQSIVNLFRGSEKNNSGFSPAISSSDYENVARGVIALVDRARLDSDDEEREYEVRRSNLLAALRREINSPETASLSRIRTLSLAIDYLRSGKVPNDYIKSSDSNYGLVREIESNFDEVCKRYGV